MYITVHIKLNSNKKFPHYVISFRADIDQFIFYHLFQFLKIAVHTGSTSEVCKREPRFITLYIEMYMHVVDTCTNVLL